MKMTAALERGAPGVWSGTQFVNGTWCGLHTCICGAMSEARDYQISGGFVTNSLCVHYLAHHREEVPQAELEKVATLQCGTATPRQLDLEGRRLVKDEEPPS